MARLAPLLSGQVDEKGKAWRRRYCLLIDRAARTIPVGFAAIETATTYCHQYFSARSLTKDDPLVVATAALYLACKVEEQPKSVVTVAEAVFSIAYKNKRRVLEMLKVREFSAKLKERILTAERALLYITGFNFVVEHPTQIALDFLQSNYNVLLPQNMQVSQEVWLEECARQSGPSYDVMNQLSLIAWNFCLVSYQSPLTLQYSASPVAAAAIFAALQILGMTPNLVSGWHWFELQPFNSTPRLLKEVLAELLTLCEHRKPRHGMDTASLGPSAAVAQQAMTVPSNALGSGQSMQELQSSIGTILGIPSSSLNET